MSSCYFVVLRLRGFRLFLWDLTCCYIFPLTISVKPFNVPDIKAEIDPLESEYNSQETESKEDIIIIDTLSIVPPKRDRGRPRKNANITVFLQDNV